MTDLVFRNDRLISGPIERPTRSPGVFETVRAYAGVPFRLDRHLSRLRRGCAVLDLPVPDPDRVAAAITMVLDANRLAETDARVRVTVTNDTADGPMLLVAAVPYRPPVGPITLHVASIRRDPTSPTTGIKSTDLTVSEEARSEAIRAGADDALLLTAEGFVSEASYASVFWVAGGVVFTPDERCGLLPGVTREAVLEVAAANSIPSTLVSADVATILQADEVFITNSLIEVLPVSAVDTRHFSAPGPITDTIRAGYRDLVRRTVAGS